MSDIIRDMERTLDTVRQGAVRRGLVTPCCERGVELREAKLWCNGCGGRAHLGDLLRKRVP